MKLDINQHFKGGFIEKKNVKSGIITVIPIHPQVEAILTKRQRNFPRKISNQKFNDYIKEVCKIVGIDEVIWGAKLCSIEKSFINLDGDAVTQNVQRNVLDYYPKYK